MNARTVAPGNAKAAAVSPRFDAKFIEDHKLIERYLDDKLPFKGARDLENWCRAHPDYLNDLRLPERAQASLKLLEASGQAVDLREPAAPWWQSPYLLIAAGVVTLLSLAAFWVLIGKYGLLRQKLEDAELRMRQGTLVQPAVETVQRLSPDHAPGLDGAHIVVSTQAPQLIDLHLDMTYTQKLNLFRITVDKQDQGRALIVNNILKDSNNDLRMTFNTTGLSAGIYTVRIEALPPRGEPIPDGWLTLEVR
ncbi:MAG TPA: hypothetical protein VME42_12510 [Steroidobacteraceae bacterium]|nr:hypothetical protein [Steroidobacteraceae bacterium]